MVGWPSVEPPRVEPPSVQPSPSPPQAAPSLDPVPGAPSIDLTSLRWETISVPFSDELDDQVEGIFQLADGELVAWGIDQQTNWYAAVSFWHSEDGHTWRETKVGVPDQFVRVSDAVSGPLGVVAVGSLDSQAAAWVSPNAEDWSLGALLGSRAYVSGVAARPDGYLAVGLYREEAAAWASADGAEWHRVGEGPLGAGRLHDVIPYEDGYLAVGVDRSGHDWDAAVWHISADGVEWGDASDSRQIAGPMDDELRRVWAYAGGLIAHGEVSDTQERIECHDELGTASLALGTTAYVCFPHSRQMLYRSVDGLRWERLDGTVPQFGEFDKGPLRLWEFNAIQPWSEGMIAVGAGSDWEIRVWLSNDPAAWEPVGEPILVHGRPVGEGQTNVISGLIVLDDRLIATGWGDDPDGASFILVGTPAD